MTQNEGRPMVEVDQTEDGKQTESDDSSEDSMDDIYQPKEKGKQ